MPQNLFRVPDSAQSRMNLPRHPKQPVAPWRVHRHAVGESFGRYVEQSAAIAYAPEVLPASLLFSRWQRAEGRAWFASGRRARGRISPSRVAGGWIVAEISPLPEARNREQEETGDAIRESYELSWRETCCAKSACPTQPPSLQQQTRILPSHTGSPCRRQFGLPLEEGAPSASEQGCGSRSQANPAALSEPPPPPAFRRAVFASK